MNERISTKVNSSGAKGGGKKGTSTLDPQEMREGALSQVSPQDQINIEKVTIKYLGSN